MQSFYLYKEYILIRSVNGQSKISESEAKNSEHKVSSAVLDDQPWWKSDTIEDELEKSQV